MLVFSVRRFWNNLENVRISERRVMMIPGAMTDRGPRKLEGKKKSTEWFIYHHERHLLINMFVACSGD